MERAIVPEAEDDGEAPAAQPVRPRQGRRGGEAVELFHLVTDISEQTNLASVHPAKVQELRARYDSFAKQAVAPKTKPKPAGYKVTGGLGGTQVALKRGRCLTSECFGSLRLCAAGCGWGTCLLRLVADIFGISG